MKSKNLHDPLIRFKGKKYTHIEWEFIILEAQIRHAMTALQGAVKSIQNIKKEILKQEKKDE